MRIFLLLWTFFCGLEPAWSARILVYQPSVSKSHHFVYRPVLQVLAEKGHHITYVTSVEWPDRHKNVEQRMLNLSLEQIVDGSGVQDDNKSFEEIVKSFSPISMTIMYSKVTRVIVGAAFENKITQDLIHSEEKYDLLISEAMRGMEGIAALQHRFNATGVVFLTRGDNAWANELTGLPDNPAYMVDAKTGYSDQMGFWERLHNVYITLRTNWLSYQNLLDQQALADKHLRYEGWESRPPLSQLIADQALVLSNSHIAVGYAYPKAPNFKEVGGTNVPDPKPLPAELEKYLTNQRQGLIYFSMGTNMDLNNPMMRPDNLRKLFLSVFAKRKEIVFWKLSGKLKEQASDNVLVSQWFPQIDVLAHNQTRVFMSHGGMLSLMESVSQGVPIIGIPIFGDQRKNVLQAVNSGFAILLEVWNLTETSLNWAIDEMIHNPRYKENAVKRSKLFFDRPMKPVDEAVYWIEYVLRNGKVLQPASAHMAFYQIYLFDVIGFLLLTTLPAIYVVKKIIMSTAMIVSRRITAKEKKS